MTDDRQKAQEIYHKVLDALQQLPDDWDEGGIARRDRTSAALVQLILNEQGADHDHKVALEAAHDVEKNALGGELAVSFQGVSIAFLAQWVQENEDDLNYKSTDAVVERVIKASSNRASIVGPDGHGRALLQGDHTPQMEGEADFLPITRVAPDVLCIWVPVAWRCSASID